MNPGTAYDDRRCECGARESLHLPWSGDCSGFVSPERKSAIRREAFESVKRIVLDYVGGSQLAREIIDKVDELVSKELR
jgi:hypothetical protein